MANQPLAFAALVGGGLLITSAVTGRSLTDVVSGRVATLSNPDGSARVTSDLHNAINSTEGLVNPFAHATGLHPGRVDMGQDFSMAPGSPIDAIGNSRVIGRLENWYNGQPFVWFQLLNEAGGATATKTSPYAGQYWYVAEQIVPTVKTGDIVAAGSQVATYAQSGTGIETGFANSTGQTLAQANKHVGANHYSPEGKAFADLLKKLGV